MKKEQMDFCQTTIQNEEASIFLFEGLEDDTSPPNKNKEATHNLEDDASPPKKRGKHVPVLDLGLPERKPETRDQWRETFQFQRYTSEPPKEVYQGMVTKCEVELKAIKKAYNRAAVFFEKELGELKKVLAILLIIYSLVIINANASPDWLVFLDFLYQQLKPCSDNSTVIETITNLLGRVRKRIHTAEEILPYFWTYVKTYLEFRDGPLLEVKRLEEQYYKKLEELAGMPRVDELVGVLMCQVKIDDIEECCGLTTGHIHGIIYFLRRDSKCYYVVGGANTMSAEEFKLTDMKNVVTEHWDLIQSILSSWKAYKTAQAKVEKDGWELGRPILVRVNHLVLCLQGAGLTLRLMCELLELLRTKDVILNGYDDDFCDDWSQVLDFHQLTTDFYL